MELAIPKSGHSPDKGHTLAKLARKSVFRFKQLYLGRSLCFLRALYWRAQGMEIGRGARFSSLAVTWPHKVALGESCSLEHNIYLNAAGPYTDGVSIELGAGCFIGTGCEFNISHRLTIGENSLIAAGTRFVDHNHGIALGALIKQQPETSSPITVGPDVWIGANSLILQGVTIGEGAVVAAGSVVTHSVPPFTIVAGSPARPLRDRREPRGTGTELAARIAGAIAAAPSLRQNTPAPREAADSKAVWIH